MTILIIDTGDTDTGIIDGSLPHEGPYATVQKYLAKFGLVEAVALLADEERLLTKELLQEAISVDAGGDWSSTSTSEQRAAATAALQRLKDELMGRTNFMDGYLRSAVSLPLSADDANAGVLEDCCLWLTRCALADDDDNATERMCKTCDEKRAWLKDVAAKRVQLVGTSGDTVRTAGRLKSGQAASGYDWSAFGGGL